MGLVRPRSGQTRAAALEEYFGNELSHCPHCHEHRLTNSICTVCRLDPDNPITWAIVTVFAGRGWEVTQWTDYGDVIEDRWFAERDDAVTYAAKEAKRRHPRPIQKVYGLRDLTRP